VDTIGSKYSALQANSTITSVESAQKKFYDNASKGRLLVPVLLVALLTARNVLIDGNTPQYLKVLPQQEFVSAMSGFLTVRFSIFLSEVTKEIRTEDWIGLVPGSLAVVIRNQWLKDKEEVKAEAEAAAIARAATAVYKVRKYLILFFMSHNRLRFYEYQVIYVTGPAAAGRHDLLSRLKASNGVKDSKKFTSCKLLTTSDILAEGLSDWFLISLFIGGSFDSIV
jgi:hypothetical protein